MEALLEKGKVRAIGVSNVSQILLEKLSKTWKVKPAVNQVSAAGEDFPHIPESRLAWPMSLNFNETRDSAVGFRNHPRHDNEFASSTNPLTSRSNSTRTALNTSSRPTATARASSLRRTLLSVRPVSVVDPASAIHSVYCVRPLLVLLVMGNKGQAVLRSVTTTAY